MNIQSYNISLYFIYLNIRINTQYNILQIKLIHVYYYITIYSKNR